MCVYLDPWDVCMHVYLPSVPIKYTRFSDNTVVLIYWHWVVGVVNIWTLRWSDRYQHLCVVSLRVYSWMGCGHTDPGVECYWCSVLFTSQQFSALTEVIFHFLTEPKEVMYLVIRRVLTVGLQPWDAKQVKAWFLPFLQVERFLAQLSEFATTNQISLGPLRSIVKSLLLVPNGE